MRVLTSSRETNEPKKKKGSNGLLVNDVINRVTCTWVIFVSLPNN